VSVLEKPALCKADASSDSVDGRIPFPYAGPCMLTLLLTVLLVLLPGNLNAQSGAAVPDISLQDTITDVAQFWPRTEGSPGEKELVAWIEARLSSMGARFSTFDFSQSDFEHSFSTCLRVDVGGKSRDSLILAVPLDSPADAGPLYDGSVNIALALDLIGRVRNAVPPLSLTVLFLGAEYGDTDMYPMGSTLFLRDFQPDFKAVVLYLNFRSAPTRVLVRGGGRGIISPYWLMNRCMDALRAAKVPYTLPADEAQVFRMSATDERTLIEPYLRAGYPSVELEGEYTAASHSSEAEWLSSIALFLQGFLSAGTAGVPDEWDRHYLLMQMGDTSLIVSEKTYLVIFGGVIAVLLLFSLLFRRGLKRYLRTLLRNSPSIIPLAVLSFLFLAAGTFALQAILRQRGFPALWRYAPLEFLALKICVALFLYAALYNLLRRLPLPHNGRFYSAAAIFFLLIDIFVIAAFNISFTFYFLWALVFIFLSSLARNRWVKALLVLPAPFWGIRGIVMVFLAPAYPFCHFIMLSPIWGNLLVAGACLPFILALIRLGLIFPGKGILRRRVRELVLAGLLLVGGGLLAARLLTFSPFSAERPQPITATQTIEVNAAGLTTSTSLLVESPGPVGALSLTNANGTRTVPPAATEEMLTLPPAESPVQISMDSSQFLKQCTVIVSVTMPSSPRLFSATLTSGNDFILYDSSFPSVRDSPRAYRLLIGASPPNPLPLELSLPSEGTFTLTLTMEFDEPLIDTVAATRPDARLTTRVRVVRSLDVKT